MEKIEIKDFLGIKHIVLDIKQVNILIGPQASGKSVIAKLLFYFKNFIFEIFSAAEDTKKKLDMDKDYKQKFKEYFLPSSWGNKEFTIKYSIEAEYIEVYRKKTSAKKKTSEIVLKYSNFYKEEFTDLRNFIKRENKKVVEQKIQRNLRSRLESSFNLRMNFLEYVSERINNFSAFEQLYIPAGRSFFANLENNIFRFLSESNTVDPFLNHFGTSYEKIRSPITLEIVNSESSTQKELSNEINNLSAKILCGEYFQQDGEDYLKMEGARKTSIANSSSGQQATLPLLLILKTIGLVNFGMGGSSIYIEEPEAHIFPEAQKNIVELISTVHNARKNNLQFFITTHSPYILTAFNNLLQAGILATDATEDKIEKISRYVPKTRFLNPQEVTVYALKHGSYQSIIDSETGLIDTNIIDDVSNDLAMQFDELLELE